MQEELDALRAEVAALRADLQEAKASQPSVMTRRRLLTGLAGLGAAGAATAVNAPAAAAADGENLVLGEENTALSRTELEVSMDQVLEPDMALRVVLEDPAEPVNRGHHSHPAIQGIGAFTGISGYGLFNGVEGFTENGVAIAGQAIDDGGAAFHGISVRGPAATFQSEDGVSLRLTPSNSVGAPTTNVHYPAGSLSVDTDRQVWLCIADGTPGTWTRLLREDTAVGRTIPITPVRALDTRATSGRPPGSPAVPGQRNGPLKGGDTITLDLAGVSPIPASASGVVGNLTVVSPSYSGYLMAGPSGTTPTTSALNFTAGAIVANAFTSQLGPDGLTVTASGTTSKTYELVVDITAYIT